MCQFVCGDGLNDGAHQAGFDAVERGLRLGVAAHGQHQLASAGHKGHAHWGLARRGRWAHHDVQWQGLLVCKGQHRRRSGQPLALGGGEFGGQCRHPGQGPTQPQRPLPLLAHDLAPDRWMRCCAERVGGSTSRRIPQGQA
jgi:hypothetical protein